MQNFILKTKEQTQLCLNKKIVKSQVLKLLVFNQAFKIKEIPAYCDWIEIDSPEDIKATNTIVNILDKEFNKILEL